MADSVASTQSRPRRAASTKRRQATVSTETENKLARAARSAQRLAQLSGASGDDSTLDLFPDDPTRATLEAMNIDIRQGTLHGFELPDVVLAAVGAIDAGDGMPLDTKPVRRVPRAARADESAPINGQLSGLDIEPSTPGVSSAGELALADEKPAAEVSTDVTTDVAAEEQENPAASARDVAAPLTPAMAAATVARSVTALRQASEQGAAPTVSTVGAASGGSKPPQRVAATFAKAATASRDAVAAEGEAANKFADGASAPAGVALAETVERTEPKAAAQPLANSSAFDANVNANAALRREAQRAAAPELDLARATAFADTVDALYGVIADQRRAATDHSRRMKWMLSIVVGALLVTVAIGITQTLLLMRLTRETTAQQHRLEQMMQNQQAAMASLVDTHIAMAHTAAAADAASATAAPAAPQQVPATPLYGKRTARAQHGHKVKAVSVD